MNEIIKDATDGGVRVVEIGAPEGATLVRYAQIVDGVVTQVVESHVDPDGVGPEWVACGGAGPGWTTTDMVTFTPPVVPVQSQRATKRAFQNRFPKATNGISTKWDAMCLFLTDDGYAASLGATGAPLYELRMLITTGVQRLNASPFVDMAPTGEAAAMTGLLTNPAIPAAFRLSASERTVVMETPLADDERYKG